MVLCIASTLSILSLSFGKLGQLKTHPVPETAASLCNVLNAHKNNSNILAHPH